MIDPHDLVNKCIKEFLDKKTAPKIRKIAGSKKELLTTLACLSKLSPQIHIQINCILKNKRSYFNSGIVYNFQCDGCNDTRYGKTIRHFKELADLKDFNTRWKNV